MLALAGAAWIPSGHAYALDLVAAASTQAAAASLCVGAALLALGPRPAAALALIGGALALAPTLSGRSLSATGGTGGHEVVVAVLNIYPLNKSWETDLAAVLAREPDVLVIPEIPARMNRAIRWHGYLDASAYEHWRYRSDTPGYILSKHPITRIDPDDPETAIPPDEHGVRDLTCVVHHPDGEFVVALLHPLSPRGAARWRKGTERLERRLGALESLGSRTGLPIILGADLNASYAQHRARLVRSAGFAPSKPIWPIVSGTFPGSWPAPARLALDDIWRSGGIRVRSWSTLPSVGSDHLGVIARLALPGDRAGP